MAAIQRQGRGSQSGSRESQGKVYYRILGKILKKLCQTEENQARSYQAKCVKIPFLFKSRLAIQGSSWERTLINVSLITKVKDWKLIGPTS